MTIMTRRSPFLAAGAVAVGLALASAGAAAATAQTDSSASIRATGQAGEQSNGYLGLVGEASPAIRAQVNSINIRRRAAYADLAARRRVTIEEVGATMACELLATAVQPGQFYRLHDGVWRQRRGNEPVQRPPYCV